LSGDYNKAFAIPKQYEKLLVLLLQY